MPANHIILQWASNAANVQGHELGKWSQSGEVARNRCVWCRREVIADFSAAASERDEEVRGARRGRSVIGSADPAR